MQPIPTLLPGQRLVARSRRVAACKTCDKTFAADRGSSRFCSLSCAAKGRARRLPTRADIFKRLMERSEPDAITGCRLWSGSADSKGYGIFKVGHARLFRAHRASWWASRGDIPDGLCVCHRCDTPACINPDHLFLGTQGDNARDRAAKGRSNRPKGADSPNAKLTDSDVAFIRQWCKPGDSKLGFVALGKRFGVSDVAVRLAYEGRTYQKPLPGQRIVGNSTYTFDHAVLNAHLADEQLAGIPADLTALSWDELTGYYYAYLNADTRRRWDVEVQRLGELICNERATRPEYQRAYGSKRDEAA